MSKAEWKPEPVEHPMSVREIHQVLADDYSTQYWLKHLCAQLAEINQTLLRINTNIGNLRTED